MDLLTRGNNETKTFLHQKLCGAPSSSSNRFSNETYPAQQTWHIRDTVKTKNQDQHLNPTPMDYQEQVDDAMVNSQNESGIKMIEPYFNFGCTGHQLSNCAVESSNQLSLGLNTFLQDMEQQNKKPIGQGCSAVTSNIQNLAAGKRICFSHPDHQVAPLNAESSYGMSDNAATPSGNTQSALAQLLYMRSLRPRIQPQIRPKPSDVAANIKDHPPPAPVPEAWCHAYYYELNQRIGEPFKGGTSHVIVDGFCAPSEAERFCLGALANVNRNPGVVNARRQIGRGVRIFRRDEDVYAECLSQAPVFIQSPIHAVKSHDHPATVYRLPSGHIMQIFDNKSFETLLAQSTSQGFNAVYSLQRMCHMRISFVKGWGEQYKRQTITSTPCWVEIHLAVPLQKLDRVLSQIPGPNDPIHSFT